MTVTPAMSPAPAPSLGRNVVLLATCQGLFQTVQSMGITASALAGHALVGVDKSWATLPIFLQHLGVMLTTVPASLLMARIGRRAGFSVGAVVSMLFGFTAAYALIVQSFALLCLATLLQGAAAAFAWYYRFAAADAAAPSERARAISLVMAGGVIAGVAGPQLAKWTVDWFAPITFVGIYVTSCIIATLSLVILQGLSIPRLSESERKSGGRPLREISRQPAFATALVASTIGYGVMTLVMSTTPLAMLACGYGFIDSATVIQIHVVAMFLPSFWTGRLVQKIGVLPVIAAGAGLEILCALVNLMGVDFWNFFIANALVGLGWNLTYVGGSTLITSTYTPAERAKVQASHDFLVYSTTAVAAGLSGFLQQNAGWAFVNLAAIPVLLAVIAMTMRRNAAQAYAVTSRGPWT